MKHAVKSTLALLLALLLTLPTFVSAEDDAELIVLPELSEALESLEIPEAELPAGDLSLEAIELTEELPLEGAEDAPESGREGPEATPVAAYAQVDGVAFALDAGAGVLPPEVVLRVERR